MSKYINKGQKFIDSLSKQLPVISELNKNSKWNLVEGDDITELVITDSNENVFLNISIIDDANFRAFSIMNIQGDHSVGDKDTIESNLSDSCVYPTIDEAISGAFEEYYKYVIKMNIEPIKEYISDNMHSLSPKELKFNILEQCKTNLSNVDLNIDDSNFCNTLFVSSNKGNDVYHVIKNEEKSTDIFTRYDVKKDGYMQNGDFSQNSYIAQLKTIELASVQAISDVINKHELRYGKNITEILTPFISDNNKTIFHEANPLGRIFDALKEYGYKFDEQNISHIPYPDKNAPESKINISRNNIAFDNVNEIAHIIVTRMDSGRYEVNAYCEKISNKLHSKIKNN